MDTSILREIGLTDYEIKIYLYLLKVGQQTAYTIGQKTDIYRAYVYDKLEQLLEKGLVSYIHKGNKKLFSATPPDQLLEYVNTKKRALATQEGKIKDIIPDLNKLLVLPKEDTRVEVYSGKEGLKYVLKDIIKTKQELLGSGVNDQKYQDALPEFMSQYFRDLKKNKIKERIITINKPDTFQFEKDKAPTTEYRFLTTEQFNPTNTYVYGDKVVIVSWGTPITSIMIKNKEIAKTYREHFECLWKIAKTSS